MLFPKGEGQIAWEGCYQHVRYCHVHHQILSGRRAKEQNKSAPIPIPGREKKEEEMRDVAQNAFEKEDDVNKGNI